MVLPHIPMIRALFNGSLKARGSSAVMEVSDNAEGLREGMDLMVTETKLQVREPQGSRSAGKEISPRDRLILGKETNVIYSDTLHVQAK